MILREESFRKDDDDDAMGFFRSDDADKATDGPIFQDDKEAAEPLAGASRSPVHGRVVVVVEENAATCIQYRAHANRAIASPTTRRNRFAFLNIRKRDANRGGWNDKQLREKTKLVVPTLPFEE
jgi:hypothetical protein